MIINMCERIWDVEDWTTTDTRLKSFQNIYVHSEESWMYQKKTPLSLYYLYYMGK